MHGVWITNVIAWEKKSTPGDLAIKDVPVRLIPGYQYFNHPISRSNDSIWNPLNFIKEKCAKEDFVIFKLDIDHKPTESVIERQLASDPVAKELIDEFYYEDHFRNPVMDMHGWWRYHTTLSDYYNLVVPQRIAGLRMHYWP